MFERYARPGSVDRLIAKGAYAKAIAVLRREIEHQPRSLHLRQKLADVLVQAGEGDRAVRLLMLLVDELASAGFFAKAIAVLKKMQRIDPGRGDVEQKLAAVIAAREEEEARAFQPGPPARVAEQAPLAQQEEVAAPGTGTEEEEEETSAVECMLFELDPELVTAGRHFTARDVAALQGSPLFQDMSEEQVRAIISGLCLRTFSAGEILVTEGEPGGSMFLIASGSVRVYVRNSEGFNVALRNLGLGDFYGEISLLTGSARTATVTASSRCEILELDRAELRRISEQHPQVATIIEEFCRQRVHSDEESEARGGAT
jgi:hypothetical protein